MSAGFAAASVRRILPHEQRLAAMRAVCLVSLVLAGILCIAGLPVMMNELGTPCAGAACHYWQLTPRDAANLARLHFSLTSYVELMLAIQLLFVGIFWGVAAGLLLRRSNEPMALLIAVTLVTFGATLSDLVRAAAVSSPAWYWPREGIAWLGWSSLFLCFYVFPDGRFVPRWTRFVATAWCALMLLNFFAPSSWGLNSGLPAESGRTLSGAVVFSTMPFFFLSVVVAQVYRYRRVSTPLDRQQTKWVVLGFIGAIGGFIALIVATPAAVFSSSNPIVSQIIGSLLFEAVLLLIPLSLVLAILRYRLWDIDLFINRALVYGSLTGCVVLLYGLAVGYLSLVFRTGGNLAISLIATGLVAVLFHPARERLQRSVNRWMYGEQDNPYAVLSRLGHRLEGTLAVEEVIPTVIETVRAALKLPYVAITLEQDGVPSAAAAVGTPSENVLSFPLSHRGEPVGTLSVSPRSGERTLTTADRLLLEDLARQAGSAAYSVRLTEELRRSRERLVALREDERRRIRRDLHDGLGPALASVMLKINTARRLLDSGSPADAILGEAHAGTKEGVADIRRLVYDLRPPVLDQLGLLGAVREAAVECEGDGLAVAVQAPETLPTLPAAVEVAAYRIVQEALTNVARHAGASTCTVRLFVGAGLDIEVTDDGVGLSGERHIGVGLASMRERAAELGGTCIIGPGPDGGVRVLAHLPMLGG